MLDHVLDRVRILEERVARLESRLPEPAPIRGRPPAPQRIRWPAPVAEEAVAAVAAEPIPAESAGPARSDLEQFVGVTVLGRAGAAALLLAAAYFGQLGWGNLPPSGRVLVVYGVGLVMAAVGAWLRSRVAPHYTAILWGGATALTYVAGCLASLLYGLVDGVPAMGLLLASAALGQALAHALRLEAFATVALAGAYAAPVLTGAPSPTPTAFFVLLLTLHGWAAWTERRRGWSSARALAVAATGVLVVRWYVLNDRVSTASFVLHVELVALALAAPELLAALARAPVTALRSKLVLVGFSCAQAVLLLDTWQHAEWTGFGLVAGAASLGAGAILRERAPVLGAGMARLGGLLAAAGALEVWHRADWGHARPAALVWVRLTCLSLVAGVLLWLRRWLRVGELGAGLAALLAASVLLGQGSPTAGTRLQTLLALVAPAALVMFSRSSPSAVLGLLVGCALTFCGLWQRPELGAELSPWVSLAFAATAGAATLGALQATLRGDRALLTAAVGILGVLGCAWMALSLWALRAVAAADSTLLWNVRSAALACVLTAAALSLRVLDRRERAARTVLGVLMLALGFVGGLLEVLDAIRGWPSGQVDVATSLYTLAFAGCLVLAGFLRRQAAFRWAGLAGFGIAAGKVVLHDLETIETPLRVLATGALGLVMLGSAFAYARRKRGGE